MTYEITEKELDYRVNKIEKRNKRVELDKRWEKSWTRKLTITGLTYAVILIYLFVVKNSNPWVNAIVPSLGFLLSHLALGWVRSLWMIYVFDPTKN